MNVFLEKRHYCYASADFGILSLFCNICCVNRLYRTPVPKMVHKPVTSRNPLIPYFLLSSPVYSFHFAFRLLCKIPKPNGTKIASETLSSPPTRLSLRPWLREAPFNSPIRFPGKSNYSFLAPSIGSYSGSTSQMMSPNFYYNCHCFENKFFSYIKRSELLVCNIVQRC